MRRGKIARRGGLVLGICNGFQILCEAGLLPGVLQRMLACGSCAARIHIRVETTDTPFTDRGQPAQVLRIPIAPRAPATNYFCDESTLAELERNRQIVFPLHNVRWTRGRGGQSEWLHRKHRGYLQPANAMSLA